MYITAIGGHYAVSAVI